MTKNRKLIEKPGGLGVIRMSDNSSVNVRYSLVVFQTVDDEAETGPMASHIEMRGAIQVSPGQGMVELGTTSFVLETNDGRCLEARAKKGDPVTRHWEIVASGPKGLEPC